MARYTKKTLWPLVLPLLIGIAVGTAIGAGSIIYWKTRGPVIDYRLKILTDRKLIPEELVKEFLVRHKVLIEQDIVSSKKEIESRLLDPSHRYDLVSLYSWQIPELISKQTLSRYNKKLVPNIKSIAADFKRMAFDPELDYSLPLFWGVNGILYNRTQIQRKFSSWKDLLADERLSSKLALQSEPRELVAGLIRREEVNFDTAKHDTISKAINGLLPFTTHSPENVIKLMAKNEIWAGEVSHGLASILISHSDNFAFEIPEESTTLWVLTLALCRGSEHKDMVSQLFDFMLSRDSVLKMVKYHNEATAVTTVENLPIHAMLKPSYLREFPLNKLQILKPIDRLNSNWSSFFETIENQESESRTLSGK